MVNWVSSWRLDKLSSNGRITAISLVLVSVIIGTTTFTSWNLYQTSIQDQQQWLLNMVETKAHMINSLAHFEREHRNDGTSSIDSKIAFDMTMRQVRGAKLEDYGIGETGEFVLGQRQGDMIAFLLPRRGGDHSVPDAVAFGSGSAAPMRRALDGEVGAMIGPDYNKVQVLAAYAPIPEMGIGLVSKINLDEIRAPFIRVGLLNALFSIVVMILAVFLTRFLTFPIIQTLEHRTQDLEKLSTTLARSNADLEQFAYVASHDLKSPLRGIENLLGWLSEDLQGRLEEKEQRYIDQLHSRTARMEALLDALLEYSRAGRKKYKIETIDIGDMIETVTEFLALPETMVVSHDPIMPIINSVRVPMELMFRNLISNSFKHHDRDHGQIHVGIREDQWFYTFSVRDDGPGIAPEYHDRVFSIFQTLKPRDEVEGSGIGLSLVKRTVDSYGGTIYIVSDPSRERGTTICFTWPKNLEIVL